MFRRLAVGLLLLPTLLFVGCEDELPLGAIAQVGTNLVSQEEFEDLKAAYEAAGRVPDKDDQPKEYESFEQRLAEHLVALEILRQEAPGLGVSITEADVQSEVDRISRMFLSEEAFEAALEKQGLTPEQLARSLRESLLFEEVKSAVTSEVKVTDEEAEAYYEDHKSEYVEQESRDVRHILVSPFARSDEGSEDGSADQRDWAEAETKAERARSEIQNGSSFVTVVEKYSDDDATRDTGGELGAITRGLMVPAFEAVVFDLQIGEISEPVKTQYGYHVIEVTDITPERQLSFDQVKEKIESALLEAEQAEAWEEWLAAAHSRLGVEYLAGYEPKSDGRVSGRVDRNASATDGSVSDSADSSGPSTTEGATESSEE